ncbi:heptaprenyl diphosphate synthase component 1 [Paenibacillus sp. JX-17]|uniref:Heptaprenyl diphosphate synthase component 1 n=1 Tax=Paenibacillus lacisoli TaxID=3064525 RepID=A0ABT9C846_9BACL|nr:heptaprenyl diphosphate synthase component 1 [Paenibacillus sp. JX-17]MDO7905080.1 heptaprenyl diphosphate synthase component 1 [Paenibacillus sp. JX-17]
MKPYRVDQLTDKYIEYDMIQRHTDLPAQPDSRARLLAVFLERSSLQQNQEELYALSTSLVQMAMDTHDLIDVAKENRPESDMRSRQLKVLAGDYFSSRFYQLLAQAGQIDAISRLSEAVCEVNARKMSLYKAMTSSWMQAETYLREMVQLKMQLFLSFSSLMNDDDLRIWELLLEEFSRSETLAGELDAVGKPADSLFSYTRWIIMEQGSQEEQGKLAGGMMNQQEWDKLVAKYAVGHQIREQLQRSVDRIEVLVRDIHGSEGQAELLQAIRPYTVLLHASHSVVREG